MSVLDSQSSSTRKEILRNVAEHTAATRLRYQGMHTEPQSEMWFSWGADALMLVAHTKKSPEPATWSAMCEAVEGTLQRVPELKTKVFTDSGGPSSAQREQLARATEGKKYRVSVVSTAPGVRFIVSSMALFNPTIRSFQPRDWQQSLSHLGVSASETRRIEHAIRDFAKLPGGERFAVLRAVATS